MPGEVVNALRSTVGKLLVEKGGSSLVNDIKECILLSPEICDFIGKETDSIDAIVSKNIRDVIVNVILDRIISDINQENVGVQGIIDAIYSGKVKFNYQCRYYHIETLLGEDVTSSLEDNWTHYDIYRLISNFIEQSGQDEEGYNMLSYAIISTLGTLLSYSEIEYNLVFQTSIIENTLVLFTRDREHGERNI